MRFWACFRAPTFCVTAWDAAPCSQLAAVEVATWCGVWCHMHERVLQLKLNACGRQVAKVEFLMFILDRLELVGQDEMQRILEMFDEADAAKDGVLNLQVRCHPALGQSYAF